jgi:hypothetical protein
MEGKKRKTNKKTGQWLIAQLVERSLSVMKDSSSNLGADIYPPASEASREVANFN